MARLNRLSLAYRPPLDWDALIAFLLARATPGVESVEASCYRRTIAIDGKTGSIRVERSASKAAIELEVRFSDSQALPVIGERVHRMFDLGADPSVIAEHFAGDVWLGRILKQHPGIRTPGAWDGFELSVRAILGQQVSVAAATTIAGRLARRFGTPVEAPDGLNRIFPSPGQLVAAPIEEVGVIGARAETIRTLARAVCAGSLTLATTASAATVTTALQALPGIGPWTAQYIAMRALGEPDAFPSGDLVLRRMAGGCTARELERRSEPWRPWRAYAVMLLWQASNEQSTPSGNQAATTASGVRPAGAARRGSTRVARRSAALARSGKL